MKPLIRRLIKTYLSVQASRTLEFIISMAFMFYFVVSLSMYFNGCEMWRAMPQSVIFFVPMGVVVIATLATVVVCWLKGDD